MDQSPEHRHGQNRPVAFGDFAEHGHAGFFKHAQRNDVNLFDFVGVRDRCLASFRPDDDRRHTKTRPGRKIVEAAQHVVRRQFNADFFMRLPKRCLNLGLSLVESTAGQGPLAGMPPQVRGAASNHEAGFAVLVGGDEQGDGGWAKLGMVLPARLKSIESFLYQRTQRGFKKAFLGIHSPGT